MPRTLPRTLLGSILILAVIVPLIAEEKKPDLSEFKTVDQASAAKVKNTGPVAVGQSGYLGVSVVAGDQGKVIVADVGTDSPAAKAGLHKNDVILKLGGQEVRNPDVFRETLLSHRAGDDVKIVVQRGDKSQEITAKLGAVSKPMGGGRTGPAVQTPTFGLTIDEIKEGEGGVITRVAADSPGAKAGLKNGEMVTKIDGKPITDANTVGTAVSEKRPGDVVTLTVKRDDKLEEVKVTLGAADNDPRTGDVLWRKPVYKLAVICVEFPDTKHNDKVSAKDWDEQFFSRDAYRNKNNATGQAAAGSLADYFQEVSCGGLKVEGKVFDWLEAKKNRMEYAPGNGTGVRDKTALLAEMVEKIQEKHGKDALKGYDGLCFVYAGNMAASNPGSLYYPHRGSLRVGGQGGKSWPYILCNEGGSKMSNISTCCHLFGQLLGLPELTARPDAAIQKGAGVWCAMANQIDGPRPQHFCAWSKEQLGWVQPKVIDPTEKQKLILSPVEGSTTECFKVLVKLDGSEYFLLENRAKKGFDEGLPGSGLLVWRVVNNRPVLEESHGVEAQPGRPFGGGGPDAVTRKLAPSVPYPSEANDSFTPKTTPSSRSQLGGGLPVNITNIRRLPDGRIMFLIGYEYQ
jgi:M6 family metalloprotease-like protein